MPTESEKIFKDIDVSGPGGGAVVIRGGEFVMEGAAVAARTSGDTKGVGVDIRVSSLDMHQSASMSTTTTGQGDGGDVFIETDTIRLASHAAIFAQTGDEEIQTNTGNAGNIKVKARQMNVETGGFLSTASGSQGEGGNLDVGAENIMLDGENTGFMTLSGTPFPASAGNIDIKTGGLTLINGAEIRSFTVGLAEPAIFLSMQKKYF